MISMSWSKAFVKAMGEELAKGLCHKHNVESTQSRRLIQSLWPVQQTTQRKDNGTLPTQVLTCSGAKGLSQPA